MVLNVELARLRLFWLAGRLVRLDLFNYPYRSSVVGGERGLEALVWSSGHDDSTIKEMCISFWKKEPIVAFFNYFF